MRLMVLAVFLMAFAFDACAAGQPQDVVKGFDDALLAAMKMGKSGGISGRAAVIEPAIDQAFDVPEMTRLILGSAGKTLQPDQMARIVTAFRQFTILSYAKNFDNFSDEKFEIDNPRFGGVGSVVVPTHLIPSDGSQPVQMDYVLKGTNDQWKISDVLAEGAVSQMAARRSEFVGILRKDGADGLIASLENKIKALASDH